MDKEYKITGKIREGAKMEFKNIDRKNKEDVALLMATNHRYFVRFVVVMVVVNMLLALGLSMLGLFFTLLAAADTKGGGMGGAVFMIFAGIVYLIVFIVQLSQILSLHKRVSATEEHFVVDADVVR